MRNGPTTALTGHWSPVHPRSKVEVVDAFGLPSADALSKRKRQSRSHNKRAIPIFKIEGDSRIKQVKVYLTARHERAKNTFTKTPLIS